ncbi:M20 family metallopeptidase [Eubacteriales bacterium OttesenSCG-928-K08]|nr:M20 family metallopeptidase [Eubacteriales bacterium OttesenSCG-928-K08]
MNSFLMRATQNKDELVADRRAIHRFGGIGFEIEETAAYVRERLKSLEIPMQDVCKCGISATIGTGAPVILLRADMDALPLVEDSGEPFAATNNTMHACGHDMHCTMLLGAARLLKEREKELKGTVKLMFQPAEEILSGANAMIEGGIMENPHVDAAMAIHIGVGPNRPLGRVRYSVGRTSHSADEFCITVQAPKGIRGINPLTIATRLILGLQEIVVMEFPPHELVDVKCGVLSAGITANTIPEVRVLLKERVEFIANGMAQAFHAKAQVEWVRGVPPMVNDPALVKELSGYLEQVVGEENMSLIPGGGGGEDFSAISALVPSMFFELGAGSIEEGYTNPNHNPKFRANEDVLPIGAALHAHCAFSYLENHGKEGR